MLVSAPSPALPTPALQAAATSAAVPVQLPSLVSTSSPALRKPAPLVANISSAVVPPVQDMAMASAAATGVSKMDTKTDTPRAPAPDASAGIFSSTLAATGHSAKHAEFLVTTSNKHNVVSAAPYRGLSARQKKANQLHASTNTSHAVHVDTKIPYKQILHPELSEQERDAYKMMTAAATDQEVVEMVVAH